MLLLDTALLPRPDRAEALTELMYGMPRATRLRLGGGPDGVRARLDTCRAPGSAATSAGSGCCARAAWRLPREVVQAGSVHLESSPLFAVVRTQQPGGRRRAGPGRPRRGAAGPGGPVRPRPGVMRDSRS